MQSLPTLRRSLRAALAATALLTIAALAGCAGGGPAPLSRAELTNPALSLEYSAWLIGPIAAMATPDEVGSYLAARNDEEAKAFIDAFWKKRQPHANSSTNDALDTYEERCEMADRMFSEGGHLGQRSDRGTIYVLYGAPKETQFQISPAPQDPPIELWIYPSDTPPGLDGRRPSRFYRFIKRGDATVTYRPVTPRTVPRPFPG